MNGEKVKKKFKNFSNYEKNCPKIENSWHTSQTKDGGHFRSFQQYF